MTQEIRCDVVDREALAARYVADGLSPDEAEAFESHYLVCRRCQEEVELAVSMHDAFSGGEIAERRRSRGPVWAGVVLAAAAGLAALLLLFPDRSSPEIAQLGRVDQPPIYLPLAVRGRTSPADSLFLSAMGAYDAGRYAEAAGRLDQVIATDGDEVPAWFFLGASHLMEGRPREARMALEQVLRMERGSYEPETRYYLAKALLRLGEGEAALAQLRSAAVLDDPVAEPAAALADSVEDLIRR